MSLNKAAIFAALKQPLAVEEVNCPDLGGTVKVRALACSEREAWEAVSQSRINKAGQVVDHKNFRASLVVLACVDDDGNRLFDDGDADLLSAGSARTLDKLFDAASRLSGLSKSDEDAMLKNSKAVPTSSSG